MSLRVQLNKAICREAYRLVRRYRLEPSQLDTSLVPAWNAQSDLRHSVRINGHILTNVQFFVRLLQRLVNDDVDMPNTEDIWRPNIHRSQRSEWSDQKLRAALVALPAMVVNATRFMDEWQEQRQPAPAAAGSSAAAAAPQVESSSEEDENETSVHLRRALSRAMGQYVRHERTTAERRVLGRVRTRFEALIEDLGRSLDERPTLRRRTARVPSRRDQ
jgi:hypothetical protein